MLIRKLKGNTESLAICSPDLKADGWQAVAVKEEIVIRKHLMDRIVGLAMIS